MSVVRITARRTCGRLAGMFSTAVGVACFCAASAMAFAFNLGSAEGQTALLPAIWALSVAPFLPALAAILGMDSWSEDRRTGRTDMLLTLAVRERSLTLGKTLGVFAFSMAVVIFVLVSSLACLTVFAPEPIVGGKLTAFIPALAILTLQTLLWSAVSVAVSAFFSSGAVAACVTVVLTAALPRGIWYALLKWSTQGGAAFGEMPLDAHVLDFASGSSSVGVMLMYFILTALFVFIGTKRVLSFRFVGLGGALGRRSSLLVGLLSTAFSVAMIMLVSRIDLAIELPIAEAMDFSQLRNQLSEANGHLRISSFMSRNRATSRSTARMLRTLKREMEAFGSCDVELRYVDPSWDYGEAERLVRLGAPENSVVFERGRRWLAVPVEKGVEERTLVSAMMSVVFPPRRSDIFWTVGHGEASFEEYGAWGMSDIARELTRFGYRNRRLDLAANQQIPTDCAMIVVAGAKNDFSRAELGRIEAYLKQGGRLLAMVGAHELGGMSSLLPAWGMRPVVQTIVNPKTLSGSDVVVSDFADHAVSSTLKGSRVVLERPLVFTPSAVADGRLGIDGVEFTPIAMVGSSAVVATVERGASAGDDLAIRPTRILAIGDAAFVMNGALVSRANANRELFLNAVAYLSGSNIVMSGNGGGLFGTGLDRLARQRLAIWSAAVVPLAVLLVMALVAARRRRRR